MMDEKHTVISAETVLTQAATSLSAAAEALEKVGKAKERSHKPPSPKRGLTRHEAANFVGVSPTTFDRLVERKIMPKPIKAFSRAIWDLKALDDAFENYSTALDDENPWN